MTTTIKITSLPTGAPDSTSVFPYVSMAEPLATGEGTINVTRAAVGTLLSATHVHAASTVTVTATGGIQDTDVQSVLAALDLRLSQLEALHTQ